MTFLLRADPFPNLNEWGCHLPSHSCQNLGAILVLLPLWLYSTHNHVLSFSPEITLSSLPDTLLVLLLINILYTMARVMFSSYECIGTTHKYMFSAYCV